MSVETLADRLLTTGATDDGVDDGDEPKAKRKRPQPGSGGTTFAAQVTVDEGGTITIRPTGRSS